MRKIIFGGLALMLGLLISPVPAAAQFFVGAGATLPQSDYKAYAKTGWAVNAGFKPYASADGRLNVWAEGLYGSNKHEGTFNEKTNIFAGFGSVAYSLTADENMSPYLIGSAGYLVHSYKPGTSGDVSSSESGFGFGGGAGVTINKFYVEARYFTATISNEKTAFVMIAAGILF